MGAIFGNIYHALNRQPTLTVHKSVAGVFAEHEKPSCCGKDDVIAVNRPVGAIVAKAQAQAAVYRAMLLDAEHDPDLPDAYRGKLELLHRELATLDRVNAQAIEALREVTRCQIQFARVMAEAKEGLEKYEAANERR